jgi:hypothetical protein
LDPDVIAKSKLNTLLKIMFQFRSNLFLNFKLKVFANNFSEHAGTLHGIDHAQLPFNSGRIKQL